MKTAHILAIVDRNKENNDICDIVGEIACPIVELKPKFCKDGLKIIFERNKNHPDMLVLRDEMILLTMQIVKVRGRRAGKPETEIAHEAVAAALEI